MTRIGYSGARGAAYGVGGAAAQFGVMSLYDDSVNASIVTREIQAGGIGGAVIPVALGGIGGAIAASKSVRTVTTNMEDAVEMGPVSKGIMFAADTFNVPGWIGGKTPYRIHATNAAKSAGQLFEAGGSTIDGAPRIPTVEIYQSRHRRKLETALEYNGYLEDFIGTKVKWYRIFKKSTAKWTHSDLKREFEEKVFPLIYQVEEGTTLPDVNLLTGAERESQRILNSAATQFHTVMKKSLQKMADEGVAGAQALLDSGVVIPRNINDYQVHHVINNRWNKAKIDSALELKRDLTDIEIDKLRTAAIKTMDEDIRKLTINNIRDELKAGAGIGAGNGSLSELEMFLPGLQDDQMALQRIARAVATGISEGTTTAAMRSSSKIDGNLLDAINEAVTKNIKRSPFIAEIRAGLHPVAKPEEVEEIVDIILGWYVNTPSPYKATPTLRYFKTRGDSAINQSGKRDDLNILTGWVTNEGEKHTGILDDDLFGLLTGTIRERTGQAGIAKYAEMPLKENPSKTQEGRMIQSHEDWVEASDLWKTYGREKHKEYSENFFEDTWRSFVGEPTRHRAGGGLGPIGRRVTTAANQSVLGLMGLPQLSDLSNVLARGWHGKQAVAEATAQVVLKWVRKEHLMKGTQIHRDMETLLGNISDQWRTREGITTWQSSKGEM